MSFVIKISELDRDFSDQMIGMLAAFVPYMDRYIRIKVIRKPHTFEYDQVHHNLLILQRLQERFRHAQIINLFESDYIPRSDSIQELGLKLKDKRHKLLVYAIGFKISMIPLYDMTLYKMEPKISIPAAPNLDETRSEYSGVDDGRPPSRALTPGIGGYTQPARIISDEQVQPPGLQPSLPDPPRIIDPRRRNAMSIDSAELPMSETSAQLPMSESSAQLFAPAAERPKGEPIIKYGGDGGERDNLTDSNPSESDTSDDESIDEIASDSDKSVSIPIKCPRPPPSIASTLGSIDNKFANVSVSVPPPNPIKKEMQRMVQTLSSLLRDLRDKNITETEFFILLKELNNQMKENNIDIHSPMYATQPNPRLEDQNVFASNHEDIRRDPSEANIVKSFKYMDAYANAKWFKSEPKKYDD